MSKKSVLFMILLSVASAGGASYLTLQGVNQTKEVKTIGFLEERGENVHFTSAQANSSYPDLTYAAEKSVPTVVGIENKRFIESSNQYYGGNSGYDPFFELFGFRGRAPQQQQPQQQQPSERRHQLSGGSGVIISEDGYIVTNNHVIEDADELTVKLSDDRTYKATLVGTDPTTDIALIKIEETNLPYSTFGDSEALRLGQWVIAVGNPYQLTSTVTAGIVSAKGRNLDVIPSQFRVESFIQTDAAVNPGNSGGALVNDRGELVGINTVIKSPTGSYTGYSFAVPSTIVKKVIIDLREFGLVQRALIGIEYQEINDKFIESSAKELNVTETSGLYVANVTENGAAQAAGVKKGDVVVEFDGRKIAHSSALQEGVAKHRPGDKITLGVKRDGKMKHFDIVLRNRIGEEKLLEKNSVDMISFLGGEFKDVDAKTCKKLGIKSGVQVVKVSKGLLQKAGITQGYIITAINGRDIKSSSDLNKIVDKVEMIDGLYPNGRYISYSIISE